MWPYKSNTSKKLILVQTAAKICQGCFLLNGCHKNTFEIFKVLRIYFYVYFNSSLYTTLWDQQFPTTLPSYWVIRCTCTLFSKIRFLKELLLIEFWFSFNPTFYMCSLWQLKFWNLKCKQFENGGIKHCRQRENETCKYLAIRPTVEQKLSEIWNSGY